ncbi:MAG: hypothetical protein ACRDVG_12310, partial [Jatrophihabitantaceae bacterium]
INADVPTAADASATIPVEPLIDVMDGWDGLNKKVFALIDPLDGPTPGQRLMIVDPVEIADQWQGLGLEQFLIATAIAELRDDRDLLVIGRPVRPHLTGRARSEPLARLVPALESLAFFKFNSNLWLLTAWSDFYDACAALATRFRSAPPSHYSS